MTVRKNETSKAQSDPETYVPKIPLEDILPKALSYLEIARDTPEAFDNPLIEAVLRTALEMIWQKLLDQPRYVMSRDEFAIFNFFRSKPMDKERAQVAAKATATYWENTWGNYKDYED
ncbi:hypothetical protein F4811DRAFT_184386 [Daldinia bambusicola]|nr:hypothetical protein F4811DRAFT_184386 [Daldinia bambusicola]